MEISANPTVSVITGYYNRAEAVELTIQSVLGQTYSDLELIAFDDCSTDGTADRLIALRDRMRDPRLKVIIHDRNKGFTRGMIEAIHQSTGRYICVQGSGDVSLPERIAHQVSLLEARPEVGAVGCWYTNVVATTGARRARTPRADGMVFEDLLKGNIFSHGEVMIRRAAYDQAGGYRAAFKFSQDLDLWLRIIRSYELATVPRFLYERYVRFDGVSYHPRKFAEQIRYSLLARSINSLPPAESEELLRRLDSDGPFELMPDSDPELQRQCVRAVLRSILFGGRSEAVELAEATIHGLALRKALMLLGRVYASPVLAPVRRPLLKALGIDVPRPPEN